MKELSATNLLKAKINGHRGAMIGLVVGGSILIGQGVWYFSILMFFLLWLQYVEYASTLKQLDAATMVENEIEEEKKKLMGE